jgi:hypothetical protein
VGATRLGGRRPKLRISYAILAELKEALKHARRESCAVEQKHQDAMALYLDTWVVGPLESAIDQITRPPKGTTE